jgi:mRNA interferase RelE/StbE
MTTVFKESFLRDIHKIRDKSIKEKIKDIINFIVEAKTLDHISGLRKLKGYKHFYRIRIREYRIGLHIDNDTVTFVVADNRKDIYKRFP